jgi:hypothetical protein
MKRITILEGDLKAERDHRMQLESELVLERSQRIAAESEVLNLQQQLLREREEHHIDQINAACAYQRSLQSYEHDRFASESKLRAEIQKLNDEVLRLRDSLRLSANAYADAINAESAACSGKLKLKEQQIQKLREKLRSCTHRAIDAETATRVATLESASVVLELSRMKEVTERQLKQCVAPLIAEIRQSSVHASKTKELAAKQQEQYKYALRRATNAEKQLRHAQIEAQRRVYEATQLEKDICVLKKEVAHGKQAMKELVVKVKSSALPSESVREAMYEFMQSESSRSDDGSVRFTLPGGGRGLTFLHVPTVAVSSTKASKKSLQRRNRVIHTLRWQRRKCKGTGKTQFSGDGETSQAVPARHS